MATCYRHPGRETGVSCSNCGNPICPDCMTATPVGMRCPDCSKQRTPVRNLSSIAVEPIATYVLVAVNVLIFLGAGYSSGATADDLKLFASLPYSDGTMHGVAEGEYWRLISSGFLHEEIWHVFMNMLALFWLGRMMEPALGHARFLGIYFVSLLGGSLGVLILDPNVPTLGASGAVYGLLGGAIVMARNRQIDLMQSGLVPILALNLAITVLFSNRGISLGGHVGGLIAGFIATWVVEELARRRRSEVPAVVSCVILGAALVAGSIVAAN